jgi:hypothetical protein
MVCTRLVFVDGNLRYQLMIWGAIGIFTAFSILEVWSVGFFYLPVAIIFGVIAIRSDLSKKKEAFTPGYQSGY